MINFGFSAYLKLICLNPKPQKSEIRKRLLPTEGAYDFHRSLRLHVQRLIQGEDLASVLSSAEGITQKPERLSTITGLSRLNEWISPYTVSPVTKNSCIYSSENGLFTVNYAPDFRINFDGKNISVHIWNTKRPDLQKNMVLGALALANDSYENDRPENVSVLSLRDQMLYISDNLKAFIELGTKAANAIDQLIMDVEDESRRGRDSGHHPPPPAP